MKNRRKQFLINRPLQFRYMAYITVTLSIVAAAIMGSLYFGIWGGVLDSFSNEQIRNDLLIATRLTEYEAARTSINQPPSALSLFKQAKKLSDRQQEIFRDMLTETNKKLFPKIMLLMGLIAWGSIYLSHKIAGPLYRFHVGLEELDKGNLKTRIYLRKSDEAQFLGARFNQTVENMDFLFSKLKNIIAENDGNKERMAARLKEELSKIKTSADR